MIGFRCIGSNTFQCIVKGAKPDKLLAMVIQEVLKRRYGFCGQCVLHRLGKCLLYQGHALADFIMMQMAVLHHSSRFLSYRATPPLTISFSAASEYHTVSSGTSLLKGVAAERMPSAIL